ncbi:MAG: hypothetical protein QOF43_2376 [Gaiellaceae bacterium]|nr:hypothetical protein [Gaiellaceae bacterium]
MRLLRRSIIGAVVLTVALLIVFVRNTGHSLATPVNENGQAQVFHPPKTVKATAEQKSAAISTLSRFVRSAIIRRDLAASWPLATAHLKSGTSHADWLSGNLAVVPYPADGFRTVGFTLKYQYEHVLGYDALLLPNKTKAGQLSGQQVYTCELHDVHGSWLVDECYPRKTL